MTQTPHESETDLRIIPMTPNPIEGMRLKPMQRPERTLNEIESMVEDLTQYLDRMRAKTEKDAASIERMRIKAHNDLARYTGEPMVDMPDNPERSVDEELETFISIWIPINVKDQQYIKEAKIDARKEFMQLIKSRDKAIELAARLEELGGVQLDYGHRQAQTFVNGEAMTVAERYEQLKAQQKETHHD